MKRSDLIGIFLMSLVSASTAFGTWFAMKLEFLPVFISATGGWLAYSEAHRQFTGEAVHKESGEDLSIEGANTWERKSGLIFGLALCVAGFPVCIFGVHETSLVMLIIGYMTFFSGYMIAHYNWFGSFL